MIKNLLFLLVIETKQIIYIKKLRFVDGHDSINMK